MTPQDKLNYQRKATLQQYQDSGDFPYLINQDCEDSYTLGFVSACMWLTEQEINKMKERMREQETTNLLTSKN